MNSPTMNDRQNKGLATKAGADKWFHVLQEPVLFDLLRAPAGMQECKNLVLNIPLDSPGLCMPRCSRFYEI